jgi:hypothetical protein
VLVTGPGKSAEKCTPEFRDLCCQVAESVGLGTERLQKSVPRLPFVLARRLDYGGAVRLRDELVTRGAEVAVVGPGETPHSMLLRSVGRKAMAMTPRVYVVMLGMGGVWFNVVRSIPPGGLIIGFAAVLASVPVILGASFARSSTRWQGGAAEELGTNVTRLLATVRDPLIHARMKSVAEAVAVVEENSRMFDETDKTTPDLVRGWAQQTLERAAGLCLALDSARSGRSYAGQTHAASQAEEIRKLDALYTRILELLGTTALQIRELAVRNARALGADAAVDLHQLRSVVSRLADEGEAWREIRQLEGGAA